MENLILREIVPNNSAGQLSELAFPIILFTSKASTLSFIGGRWDRPTDPFLTTILDINSQQACPYPGQFVFKKTNRGTRKKQFFKFQNSLNSKLFKTPIVLIYMWNNKNWIRIVISIQTH